MKWLLEVYNFIPNLSFISSTAETNTDLLPLIKFFILYVWMERASEIKIPTFPHGRLRLMVRSFYSLKFQTKFQEFVLR